LPEPTTPLNSLEERVRVLEGQVATLIKTAEIFRQSGLNRNIE
jgi:hypothetical protein